MSITMERGGGIALWRQIHEQLRNDILNGVLKPGGMLPTEHALAEQFSVNRHTVRRAISALAEQGLVETRQGSGTYVPEAVMDERMKYRVVCPKCQTPRNLRVLRTKEVGYDPVSGFYLVCDNSACGGARLVSKEGDELGIETIRGRLEIDDKVMKNLLEMEGIPKIYLRNSVPVDRAPEFVDDYEITPAYHYERDEGIKSVKVIEEPWVVKDDRGIDSHSLLPQPVAVGLIKQIAAVLGL